MGVAMACIMCTQEGPDPLKNKKVFTGSDKHILTLLQQKSTNQINLKHVYLSLTLIKTFIMYALFSSNMSTFLFLII